MQAKPPSTPSPAGSAPEPSPPDGRQARLSSGLAQLTRLRIAGFKSFAEPVSLDILPGLTGIVGPNGCGKSNVVEALRWAMGESSARSLRGGEMDDVIFAGTTARASRNLAEVTITLEAGENPFPAPFEAEAELAVTRRIERGAGSAFRANGREQRARDVQTLFADLASGARSSGMVSQGRVAALVNARPEERRQVLEEAAGITGLHARRHDAELKLRAAEQNLARSEDVRGQLESSRESLRRQARQAARYRSISGLIRAAEAEHIAVLHARASSALADARAQEASAGTEMAQAEAAQADASRALDDAEAALAAPREQEALARTALERRRLESETLQEEASRVQLEAAQAEARVIELEADLAEAARAEQDAAASEQRLQGECASLSARLARLPGEQEAAQAQAMRTREAAEAAARLAQDAAWQHNAAAAQARHLAQAEAAEAARLGACALRHEGLQAEWGEACARLVDEQRLEEAAQAVADAEHRLEATRGGLGLAETARLSAASTLQEAEGRAERLASSREASCWALDEAVRRRTELQASVQAAQAALQALVARRLHPARLAEVEAAFAQAETEASRSEQLADAAEQQASDASRAAAEARRDAEGAQAAHLAAQADLAAAQASLAQAEARAADEQAALARAAGQALGDAALRAAAHACTQAEQGLAAAEAAAAGQQRSHREAAQALAHCRAAASAAGADAARLQAEADGLAASLGNDPASSTALAALDVPEGLEAALAAALGEAAAASLDPAQQAFWRSLPPLDHAAAGHGPTLASLVGAPQALARSLACVVLLEDGEDGDCRQHELFPGMSLVSREGGLWRWDGLVVRPGAPNPEAIRLARRRQHARAKAELVQAARQAAEAGEALLQAERREAASREAQERAGAALADAGQMLRAAMLQNDRRQAEAAQASSRIESLRQSAALLGQAATEAAARQQQAEASCRACGPADCLSRTAEAAQAEAVRAEAALQSARLARRQAREQAAGAAAAAHRLAAEDARLQAAIGAAGPALDRLQADLRAAGQSEAAASAALSALPHAEMLRAELAALAASHADSLADEALARTASQAAMAALDAARAARASLLAESSRALAQHAVLSDTLERSGAELAGIEQAKRRAEAALAALPDVTALEEGLREATLRLEAARGEAAAADGRVSALQAETVHATRAQEGLQAELHAWQRRLGEAAARHATLSGRVLAARTAWVALRDRPAETVSRAEQSGAALAAAQLGQTEAAARLAGAEQRLRASAACQRDAAQQGAQAREALMRAETGRMACETALHAVLARAAERLGPDATLPDADDASGQEEERTRRKSERLAREREEMGAVNLRADMELEAIEASIGDLERERSELTTAIARLRGQIGHHNREARERLSAVFTEVDRHFRALFTRMMGGGRAHLALAGADDPLEAGLEIYAEPPGKKLAALSLLSGGEQALTALSLIFAVFRCAPAPLCVLDEVDAPLDDANVGRFCTLLEDMVRDTGTRFLVVTHHQLTMSRMDRLFGVTMQERGVSRLLSVDLRRAAAMVEPVLQAAE